MALSVVHDKYILVRNLALLCMIGNLLYFIFPFPAIVWRLTFVVLSLCCVYKDMLYYGLDKIERSILIFVILNLVYFFVSYLWIEPSTTVIGNTLYALLSFILFSFLGKRGLLTDRFVTIASIVLVTVSIPSFYNAQQIALSKVFYRDSTTVNSSVLFLMLLPFLFVVKNKMISLFIFCVCLFFFFFGAKRGNIVAAVIPSILYVWVLLRESRRSFIKIILLIIAIIAISYWLKDLVLSNEYLLKRIDSTLEGDSSGRDVIYDSTWNLWYNSNSLINILFGFGYDGTVTFSPTHHYAHNDWLEIIVNFGLLGILCYVWIFITIFKTILKIKLVSRKYILESIVCIWILKTLFSMGYTEESMALMAIPFGFIYSGIQSKSN